jgi:5'-nucleotidase
MRTLVEGLPPKTLLNVNVPAGEPKGLRFTRLGHRVYSDKIVEHVDPRGRTHYWIGTGEPTWEALEGTDMGAVHEGYVAVTPLHLDLTNHRALAAMADWTGALDAQVRRGAGTTPAAPKPAAPPAAAPRRGRKR